MEFECDSNSSTDIGDESELELDTSDDNTQMLLDRQLYKPEPNAPSNEFNTSASIEQLEAQIY